MTAFKYVFVDSAMEDYLEQTNASISRIGILTGLPKTEVAGIRDTEPESKAVAARMNASVQVLSAWHADPEFTGPYGIPLELTYESSTGFDGLADRYGNGLPTEEILNDLIRAGCVARGKRRTVKVIRRSYLSGNIDPASIGYAGRCLKTLAETLEFNLERSETQEKRFQRQLISTLGIRASDLPAFNELLKEAGQKFLEDLDSWTTEREKALKNLEKIPNEIPRVYPGVGLYMFFNQGPAKKESRKR
jgi:predicted transcriptional regulator